MPSNIHWIVEAQIKAGQRQAFEAVMQDIVTKTQRETEAMAYQYYVSDEGQVALYENFQCPPAAHVRIEHWDSFAKRWISTADPIRMVNLSVMSDRQPDYSPALPGLAEALFRLCPQTAMTEF